MGVMSEGETCASLCSEALQVIQNNPPVAGEKITP